MASPIYATFTDEQGQQIKAGVTIEGREGQAEGLAFDYEVLIPADKNTGQLTAIRQHKDVVLTKEVDSASPVLFDACCRGRTLRSVTLDWYHADKDGKQTKYFTHKLTNVKVVGFRQFIHHVKAENSDVYGHQEQISMRFQKIELNYPDGNIMATDDWKEAR